MRLRLISLLGIVGLALGLLVAPVGATTVIDFSTGNAGFVGSLNFSTGGLAGTNVIGIVGSIVGLGLTTTELLLTGTISSYSSPNASYGLVAAVGLDSKA